MDIGILYLQEYTVQWFVFQLVLEILENFHFNAHYRLLTCPLVYIVKLIATAIG